MGFRCELCDEWLPMLQFSKLCPTCYKIRTIVKCYSAKEILEHLEKNFLVSNDRYVEQKQKDEKFFIEEEKRLEREFNAELARLQKEKLETIKEEEEPKIELKVEPKIVDDNKVANDLEDYDKPHTRNHKKKYKSNK